MENGLIVFQVDGVHVRCTCGREAIGLRRGGNVTNEIWKRYIEEQKPPAVSRSSFTQANRLCNFQPYCHA